MLKTFSKIILGILFIWVGLSAHQIIIYERGVYDCSNMVVDQEQFFDNIGVDTKIGMRYGVDGKASHVWLIFPFDIPFECIILFVNPFNYEPDRVFNSVEELISIHPHLKYEFTASHQRT